MLWAGVAATAIALAAGAVLYLAPWQTGEPSVPKAAPTAYYEFPKINADLKPSGRYLHVIALQVVVELSEDDLPRLDEVKRKVLDGFHVRIRELKRAELVGKAGIEALRAEFLDVVNAAMGAGAGERRAIHGNAREMSRAAAAPRARSSSLGRGCRCGG